MKIQMSFSLEELARNPDLLKQFRARHAQPCEGGCGQNLSGTLTGRNIVNFDGKEIEVCDDCFYGMLGEVVEQYPIVSAGIRRS